MNTHKSRTALASGHSPKNSLAMCSESHVQYVLIHVLKWFMGVLNVDSSAKHPVINVVRGSQLCTNLATWLVHSKAGTKAIVDFMPEGATARRWRSLPPLMAMIHVGCQVSGLPNWTQAGVAAKDLDSAMDVTVHQLDHARTNAPEQAIRMGLCLEEHLESKARALLEGFEKCRDCTSNTAYAPIPFYEMDLMHAMRDATGAAAKKLVIKSRAIIPDVKCVLKMLVDECSQKGMQDSSDDEDSVVARLAETMAEHFETLGERLDALTTRVETHEESAQERLADVTARMSGTEQIVQEASDDMEERFKHHMAFKKEITKRLQRMEAKTATIEDLVAKLAKAEGAVRAVEGFENRVAKLERIGANVLKIESLLHESSAQHEGWAEMSKSFGALHDKVEAFATRLDAVEMATKAASNMLATRAVATQTHVADERFNDDAQKDFDKVFGEMDAMSCDIRALKRLVLDLGDVRVKMAVEMATMKKKIEALVVHVHAQFCSQWNTSHMQWQLFQSMGDVPPPKMLVP